MCLRKLSRDGSKWTMRLRAAASVALALGLAGCSAAYVEQDAATVMLVVESIAAGSPVLSDVRGEGGAIINCQVDVSLSARAKNPTGIVGASEDVRITRYDVAYRRSDGRGTEGLDIPYRISGNMTLLLVGGASGVTDVAIDLVRHQAKLEPPLSNIVGLQVVTMFADVTFYGETISRKTVTAQGSVQVTFADYADGTTTCEGS